MDHPLCNRQQLRRSHRAHSTLVGFTVGIIVLLLSIPTLARPLVMAQTDGSEENQNKPTGFAIRKEDQKVIDALDEFSRYAGKEAWEKAFASLATAADATPTGLIPSKDGFYIPTRIRIRQVLCSIDPAGRSAYRLFNDAKAKAEFDKLGAAVTPEQLTALRKLADQYFISSIGDQAADRLADALFESGDFAGAAGYWQSILTDYPDSSLPALRLLTKRGVALSRAGDRPSFDAVVAMVKERYPGQSIHIGGKDVVAADYLAALPTTPTTSSAEATTNPSDESTAPLDLPKTETPAWQIPLVDDELHKSVQQLLVNQGWGMYAGGLMSGAPAVDVDHQRLYANWLGTCFAADLRTGKIVWRTGKFTDVAQRIQQMVQQGQDSSGDTTTCVGDRVLFVHHDPKRNDYNSPRQISCMATDTGKVIWSSDNVPAVSNWSFMSQPLVVGQTILTIAHGQQTQEANVLAISLKDGSYLWSLLLGTPTMQQNFRGMQMSPTPVLSLDNGKLYVLTNNGALLAVDLASKTLEWAFTFGVKPGMDPRFGFNPYMQPATPPMPGAIATSGGLLYLKESGNNAMYCVDPSGPSLKWKRPIDETETIVHVDNQGMLLIGEDLSYMDLPSRDLVWSARLPSAGGNIRPLLGTDHLCMFASRGIFDLDSTNGDTRRIFRGYDRDSSGGMLLRTNDRLVTVSNRSITAYPVP